jgi:heat shock protein HslJ
MSMKRLLVLTGTCVVAVGMLAACAGAPGASSNGDSGSHNAHTETTADQLVGTWVVGERFETPNQPYLTIIDDGTWRGSDGCNGVEGTWELSAGGKLEVTAGPSTMMYCEGKPLPSLFAAAKAASVADETLTLMDDAGEVTATLPAGQEEVIPLESE